MSDTSVYTEHHTAFSYESSGQAGAVSSAVRQHGIYVRTIRCVEEIEQIRDAWTTWQWHPNADIDFYLHTLDLTPQFIRPHVLVLYRDNIPSAMLIGRLVQGYSDARLGYTDLLRIKTRSLTFIYGGQLGDLSTEHSEMLTSEIIRSLRAREADLATFRFIRVDSPLYRVLRRYPNHLMRDAFPLAQRHWSLALPKDFKDLVNGMSGHEKRQVRRRARQLQADCCGNVRIDRVALPCDLNRMSRDVEEIAKKTYQRGLGAGFVDSLESRKRLEFEAQRRWLSAQIMYVADQPCAFWIGSLYGNVFYSGDVGYDPVYHRYGIGKQLFLATLQELCERHVREMDFGLGDADWKHRFGNRSWQEASLHIFAPTLKALTIKALRTPTILFDKTVKRMLLETETLTRIKKLWRDRARKSAIETSNEQNA